MESYESGAQAQYCLTGGNDRRPTQSEVLRTNHQEEEISLEIDLASTDLQLHDGQSSGDSTKDEFLFTGQSEPLSISDRVKNYIQAFTSMPIIWWPLSDPQRPLEQGKTRMTWQCVRDVFI
jgi:hypothetical protein